MLFKVVCKVRFRRSRRLLLGCQGRQDEARGGSCHPIPAIVATDESVVLRNRYVAHRRAAADGNHPQRSSVENGTFIQFTIEALDVSFGDRDGEESLKRIFVDEG